MVIVDCEAKNVIHDPAIKKLLSTYETDVVSETLNLSSAVKASDLTKRILVA